jgi:chromosome condensin MukBEF ATPase and DNA-binding subunit MukB
MDKEIKITKPYDKKQSPKIICQELTKTVQHIKKDCDINNIINRFTKTGIIDHTTQRKPQYTEDQELPNDYMVALNKIKQMDETFDRLPKDMREKLVNVEGYINYLQELKINEKREAIEKQKIKENQEKIDEKLTKKKSQE